MPASVVAIGLNHTTAPIAVRGGPSTPGRDRQGGALMVFHAEAPRSSAGLSEDGLARLAALEATPALTAWQVGEARALQQSSDSSQRARVNAVLARAAAAKSAAAQRAGGGASPPGASLFDTPSGWKGSA